MPRSKEGKTREKIDQHALESAVNDVLKGTLKINEAARRYGLRESEPISSEEKLTKPSTSAQEKIKIVTPEMVRPFPKAATRKKTTRGRQPGKTRILTDTPEKKLIEQQKRMKDKKKDVVNKRLFRGFKKNLNRPNLKKKFKTTGYDTSSEDEDISLPSSDEEFNNASIEEQIKEVLDEEMEVDLETVNECNEVKENDYILVKVPGKKRVLYYVAKVLQKTDMYEIQYLVKTGANTFVLRDETKFEIDEGDIICKLPLPITSGTSERLKEVMKFPVDVSTYEMPMN